MTQQSLLIYRLSIGLAQGIWLYFLVEAFISKTWPATNGYVFGPLLVIGVFVPLIAISALSNMRWRTLLVWLGAASVLCAGLAFYNIFRVPFEYQQPRVVPIFSLTAILFISHTLIVAGKADRRWIATYSTHFDTGWKHGVQIMLAMLFVGVFWGIRNLGTALFELVNITFIRTLITNPKFAIPVTTVGFAYALQRTDVRTELARGRRTLLLLLLSWLLPVMTVLAIGFLLALPFTGLEVLWKTKFAAGLLLIVSAALIFLVDAVYQDGRSIPAVILRYISLLVPAALIPLVAIAAYALTLRVTQYGWSTDRVLVFSCIVVAACYAIGYSYAAVRSGLSLRQIEPVNILVGFVIVCVLIALNTPIADPIRISVESQVARLESGQTTPEKFDYEFLRFDAGSYGTKALTALSKKQDGPEASVIAVRAKAALDAKTRTDLFAKPEPLTVAKRLSNITILYPEGASFPSSLLEQDWTAYPSGRELPPCIKHDAKCDAVLIDLDDDGKDEVLLFFHTFQYGYDGEAFKMQNGKWTYLGSVTHDSCSAIRDAFRTGRIETVASLYKDIQVGGQRIRVYPKFECAHAPSSR